MDKIYQWYEDARDSLARYELEKQNPERHESIDEMEKWIKDRKEIVHNINKKHPELKKQYEQKQKEKLAFAELKTEIVKLMFEFTNKYAIKGENCLYPNVSKILVDVLVACLSEAQYQIKGIPAFTSKQIDHICYQIGEWYLMMKPLLEGQHNLGRMKEKLKIMICGD